MAQRFKVPSIPQEVRKRPSDETPQSNDEPRPRADNAAIERWLQLHLRQIYEEVSNEPLPNELIDIIDRFRKRWQIVDGDPAPEARLSPSVRRGS